MSNIPSKKKPQHYFSEKPIVAYKEFRISAILNNQNFEFITAPGVFSPKKVDLGTTVLIKKMEIPESGLVLDMGCGYGVVGIYILKTHPEVKVHFVDKNSRSIELTKKNIQLNKTGNYKIFNGDIDEVMLKNGAYYDAIYYNPPVKIGQQNYLKQIINALNYLNDNGSMFIVIKKKLGAQSAINHLIEKLTDLELIENFEVEIKAKNSGYWVSQVKKIPNVKKI